MSAYMSWTDRVFGFQVKHFLTFWAWMQKWKTAMFLNIVIMWCIFVDLFILWCCILVSTTPVVVDNLPPESIAEKCNHTAGYLPALTECLSIKVPLHSFDFRIWTHTAFKCPKTSQFHIMPVIQYSFVFSHLHSRAVASQTWSDVGFIHTVS